MVRSIYWVRLVSGSNVGVAEISVAVAVGNEVGVCVEGGNEVSVGEGNAGALHPVNTQDAKSRKPQNAVCLLIYLLDAIFIHQYFSIFLIIDGDK
ncbi:hypothetical protein SDC9_177448 [bioreactor metagenome]|uniref:Uncharacterized protein n=1 Tax=bioreactor metagenome TaxID=1076179 RepID=A0A645GT14_9ZZZZ